MVEESSSERVPPPPPLLQSLPARGPNFPQWWSTSCIGRAVYHSDRTPKAWRSYALTANSILKKFEFSLFFLLDRFLCQAFPL